MLIKKKVSVFPKGDFQSAFNPKTDIKVGSDGGWTTKAAYKEYAPKTSIVSKVKAVGNSFGKYIRRK